MQPRARGEQTELVNIVCTLYDTLEVANACMCVPPLNVRCVLYVCI